MNQLQFLFVKNKFHKTNAGEMNEDFWEPVSDNNAWVLKGFATASCDQQSMYQGKLLLDYKKVSLMEITT